MYHCPIRVYAFHWSSTSCSGSKTKRRITYEYVVWEGINDTPADIRAFLDFCRAAPCKVNLIEYNPIDEGDFRQAPEEAIQAYVRALESAAGGLCIAVVLPLAAGAKPSEKTT